MNLSEMLKTLAEGINPETGEVLPDDSETNEPETIRMLFRLANELSTPSKKKKSIKFSKKEKMEQNLEMGRPARSHFPWEEEEKEILKNSYENGSSVKEISTELQRTEGAIAAQLERMGLITEDERSEYKPILS